MGRIWQTMSCCDSGRESADWTGSSWFTCTTATWPKSTDDRKRTWSQDSHGWRTQFELACQVWFIFGHLHAFGFPGPPVADFLMGNIFGRNGFGIRFPACHEPIGADILLPGLPGRQDNRGRYSECSPEAAGPDLLIILLGVFLGWRKGKCETAYAAVL